jgi:hypothetical protein
MIGVEHGDQWCGVQGSCYCFRPSQIWVSLVRGRRDTGLKFLVILLVLLLYYIVVGIHARVILLPCLSMSMPLNA